MNEGPIAHNILDFFKSSTTSPMSLSSKVTLLNAETHKQDSSSRLLWSIAVLILLLICLYCLACTMSRNMRVSRLFGVQGSLHWWGLLVTHQQQKFLKGAHVRRRCRENVAFCDQMEKSINTFYLLLPVTLFLIQM